MQIFVDVVAVLNFLVDFLLILGTNRLAGFQPEYGRAAVAAVLGGVYGGACLFPDFLFLADIHWRAICLMLMSLIAFGWNRSALQRGGIFVLLSMALGGIALGMGQGGAMMLMLSAGLMWLLCTFSFRGSAGSREYLPVKLFWGDKQMNLIALKDTGNTLRDPVTGEQVLVAGADIGERLLGLTMYQLSHPIETLATVKIAGLRLIPYHAVGQTGSMLLAVRFPKAQVGKKNMQPLVAFAPDRIAQGDVYQMLTGGVI